MSVKVPVVADVAELIARAEFAVLLRAHLEHSDEYDTYKGLRRFATDTGVSLALVKKALVAQADLSIYEMQAMLMPFKAVLHVHLAHVTVTPR